MSDIVDGMYWQIVKGEVGAVRTGVLKSAGVPFPLGDVDSLVLIATRVDDGPRTIDEAECIIEDDQGTLETPGGNAGAFRYIFDSTTANITPGTYNIQFKTTDGPNTSIWPKTLDPDDEPIFGKLIVGEAL
jgi:hypothetical protein